MQRAITGPIDATGDTGPIDATEPTAPIEAARLEAALSRLRETAPALVPELGSPVSLASLPAPAKAWLHPVFRAMVKRDPAGAGRLVVALLPGQPLVEPLPLAYDLVLSDFGCVAVTAAIGSALVELRDDPRPRQEVQLQVRGELASLARLLAAGPVRRRLRRGLARTRGDRRTSTALRALVRTPLSLEQLHAAGVRPNPILTLSLIAAMIDPSWTVGERFSIGHREPAAAAAGAYLRVRDGEPVVVRDPVVGDPAVGHPVVGDPPVGDVAVGDAAVGHPAVRGRPTTTIVCPAGALLLVFGGDADGEMTIEGERQPIAVLRGWVNRAQSG